MFLALVGLIGAFRPQRIRMPLGSALFAVRPGGENDIAELTALWGTDEEPAMAVHGVAAPKGGLERLYEFARDVLLMVDYEVGNEAFTR